MNAVVIKIGGAQVTPEKISLLANLVQVHRGRGLGVVIVHGGGRDVADLQAALGHTPQKRNGLRVTPEVEMPAVTMALRGGVNTRVVGTLVSAGLPALGLSGVDLALLRSEFLNARDLGRVGGPPEVDTARLTSLLEAGLLPVLASICLGPDGRPLNVNADTVAHSVAVALKADLLDFVSDVPGVLNRGEVEPDLGPPEVNQMIRDESVKGGMIPKLQAAIAAVQSGVDRVRIGSFDSLATGKATEVHA